MDVRLSTEQVALRDSATMLVGSLGPRTVADLGDDGRATKLDAAVADAGWRDLRTGDDDGRPWASGVEACILAEQLGRGLADTAFLGPTLAAELRRLAGAPAATDETVAFTPDLSMLAVAPDSPTSDRLATDSPMVAVDTAGATHALVLRATPGGHALGRVALGAGVTQVDLTRAVSAIPAGTPVEAVDGGGVSLDGPALDRVIALGLAISTADLVGIMTSAVEVTTAYAAERRQYGQPVGAFQAVQHLLADALVLTEGSRSLSQHASWAVDALAPAEAVTAAATAKAYATRAARDVCETAIQVHGGIGNTWECIAHVHLRRALLSSDVFGGVDANLERVLADRLGTA